MKPALFVVLAACGGGGHVATPDAAEPMRVDVGLMRPTMLRAVDVLFVIDDGPASILDKQTNLKANFPAFLNVLNELPGGLPDLHIGVVTTDLGASSMLDAQPATSFGGCTGNGKNGELQTYGSAQVIGKFISDISDGNGDRTTNYSGTLPDAFSAIASAGAAGCGFEQPIEAMRRALHNNPVNAGFLRPDAALAIVNLTDEDDHSALHDTLFDQDPSVLGAFSDFRSYQFGVTCQDGGATPDAMATPGMKDHCASNESSQYTVHLADEVAFLHALKTEPRDILYAGIVGPSSPVVVELDAPPMSTTKVPAIGRSCMYEDSSGSLEQAAPAVRISDFASQLPRADLEPLCQEDLSGPEIQIARSVKNVLGDPCLTRDIAMPADCTVTDDTTGAPLPFTLVEDPATCPDGQHLRLDIGHPPPTWARVRCTVP